MKASDAAGRSLLPRARKTRAILGVVALAAPRPILRLQLTALLWSQRDRDQARASLRQAVHELQDILGLGHGRFLFVDRHNIALRGPGLWVDALTATQTEAPSPEQLELFQDTLLEDLGGLDPAFDRWLDDERRRLRRMACTIGESVLSEQRDPEGQLAVAERLLSVDRTHEGAWRTLMRAHADRGDRRAAIRAYDRCRATLADAAQLAPSADTDELIARIRGYGEDPPTVTPNGDVPEVPLSRPPAAEVYVRRDGIRIGILPLRIIGGAADDELSIGLAEEITIALSRFRWISCVPATALGAMAGQPTRDVLPRAGLDWAGLDMDFVLDGTIQRSVSRVRVMARLLDMRASGSVIWAHRFDRQSLDTLTLQDEIGAAIVAQLDPELMMHEGQRTASRRLADPTAQELVIQAIPAIYRLERGSFRSAGELLERALATDPGNSVAHAWYAYWHLFLVGQGWADDPAGATNRGAELAERAVTLDPGDARALTLAGHVRSFLAKHPEEGSALHERALALNPNLALAWCFSGLTQSYLGHHAEAIRRIRQGLALSPSDPHRFFFDMALIMPHLLSGEYEQAVAIGRQAIELNPWFSSSYKGHLSALGHLGRTREASAILARLLQLEPDFCVAEAVKRSPIDRPEDIATYAAGLRKAGLREAPPG